MKCRICGHEMERALDEVLGTIWDCPECGHSYDMDYKQNIQLHRIP